MLHICFTITGTDEQVEQQPSARVVPHAQRSRPAADLHPRVHRARPHPVGRAHAAHPQRPAHFPQGHPPLIPQRHQEVVRRQQTWRAAHRHRESQCRVGSNKLVSEREC